MHAFEQMETEHSAWRIVCLRLEALTKLDVDEQTFIASGVVQAIQHWGEELAELRLRDVPEHHVNALKEYRELAKIDS